MLLKKNESGRKSKKVDELAGFELLILTGIISLILAGNYIAGYSSPPCEALTNIYFFGGFSYFPASSRHYS